MRNPNGYGSVVKLSGNRRKPYTARKTTGWNEKGHPIYLVIGYYATREEGLIALADYNKNPYDIDKKNMTLKELYELWLEKISPKLSKSLQGNLRSAWKHIQSMENLFYKDIRSYQMQDTIDTCGKGYSTQASIKNLWGYLDRFALETDVIDKMYSVLTKSAPVEESHKEPFTDQEIDILWQHKDDEWIDTILILLYSGWRNTEFVTLKTENIDLKEGTMKGGIKTKSGKNRIVPIHSKILPLIKARYNPDQEYLILNPDSGKPFDQFRYRDIFKAALKKLGISHNPHETRHTFRSRLDAAGGNKTCIDLLMGHKSRDVGERVYTHKTIQDLKDTIELITR